MSESNIYDLLKMLEISLEEGFPIIPRRFTIVKTNEIMNLIGRIYESLPDEIKKAKEIFMRSKNSYDNLKQKTEYIQLSEKEFKKIREMKNENSDLEGKNVYHLLELLELSIYKGVPVVLNRFKIVKTKEIETIIDKIYATLPVEIQEARSFLIQQQQD